MLYIKLVWMCLAAVGTSVFVYPFLHELGHLIAGILTGADIVGMSVFPVSYVSMMVEGSDVYKQVIIGMAGLILPMTAFLLKPQGLTMSTMVYALRSINVLAWTYSSVAIILSLLGYRWDNEDVMQVINCIGGGEVIILLLSIAALAMSIYFLIKSKPVDRMMSFF